MPQEAAKGWTLTQRDKAGRPTSIQHFDGAAVPTPWGSSSSTTGTTTISYVGNVATVTDPASKTRASETDGVGRLKKVVEAGAAETLYTYDPLDNLTKVEQKTDAGQLAPNSNRVFEYSSLSRLKWVTNPETLGSATYFSYDKDGNLAGKKDPAAWRPVTAITQRCFLRYPARQSLPLTTC